jgi:hypothetical protein
VEDLQSTETYQQPPNKKERVRKESQSVAKTICHDHKEEYGERQPKDQVAFPGKVSKATQQFK